MENFSQSHQYIDLKDLHKLIELMDGAISLDGKYVAFVRSYSDVQTDEFAREVQVLAVYPEICTIWSSRQKGIHTLRFSPESQYLAFFRTSSSETNDNVEDEFVVYSLVTKQIKVLFKGTSNFSNLVWSPIENALFFAYETSSNSSARNILYIDNIPRRLPWWHKQMHIKKVSFTDTGEYSEVNIPLSSEMTEIGHICISTKGNTLTFIEERCDNGTKITLYLHRIDLNSLQVSPEIALPNSSISTPILSPNDKYIAYVGGRVDGLQEGPVSLDLYSDWTMSQKGYGINVYDTHVHIVDFYNHTIAQLATNAALSAGIPIGLSPLHQEIYWSDNLHISYIVTQGNQTAIADQRIDDDSSLQVMLLGNGSSRGHSFATDGTCFFFQSEQGQPFVPAITDI